MQAKDVVYKIYIIITLYEKLSFCDIFSTNRQVLLNDQITEQKGIVTRKKKKPILKIFDNTEYFILFYFFFFFTFFF